MFPTNTLCVELLHVSDAVVVCSLAFGFVTSRPIILLVLAYAFDCSVFCLLTLDEDCRQAEEPKQLVDEASRFYLGRQRQHSMVICSGALLFSSRVLRPSLFTLCSHMSGRCAVELHDAFHLWYPPFLPLL